MIFIGETIERLTFDQTLFKNVTFCEVFFRLIELTDVIFDHCDFSNCDFSGGIIHRTELRECKFWGAIFRNRPWAGL
ncbi:MAG TPA: pentapeptide repeat-containing protein [Bacillales bacterium]|nr:pentapeptide repeat-containing protein [Bacillales bacterium]